MIKDETDLGFKNINLKDLNLNPQSKMQYVYFKSLADLFLPLKIPEESSRRSMLFRN